MIEANNNNIETIENYIEKKNDYENGRINHGLKNEFRKNQNETKRDLIFKINLQARGSRGKSKDLLLIKIELLGQEYF